MKCEIAVTARTRCPPPSAAMIENGFIPFSIEIYNEKEFLLCRK